MTLIIEDGTKVANANSYITEAQYQSWADARFGASRVTAPADDAAAELLILRAMDYFENLRFKGYKSSQDQSLQWPRYDVIIDNYRVANDEIPSEVIKSIYELTYAEESGEGQLDVVERKVSSEKVGPISVTYADNSNSRNSVVAANRAYRKLVISPFAVNRI